MRRFGLALAVFSLIIISGMQPAICSSLKNLNDITVTSDSVDEVIHLQFANPYERIPSLDFEAGLLRVILPHTEFMSKLSMLTINDRFIQSIRMASEGTSSILEVQFSDLDFEAIGLVSYRTDGDSFNIIIRKKHSEQDKELEEEITPVVNTPGVKKGNSLIGNYFAENDFTLNIVKMLLVLFIILVFFYVVLWAYKRFFLAKIQLKKGKYSIKVASSYHISPKQKVVIVEVNDMAFACGVTPTNITVISEVSKESFKETLDQLKVSSGKPIDFSDLRNRYIEYKKKKNQMSEEKEPATESNFASELISRVKKLKPLD